MIFKITKILLIVLALAGGWWGLRKQRNGSKKAWLVYAALVLVFAAAAYKISGLTPPLTDAVTLTALGEKRTEAMAEEVFLEGYTVDGKAYTAGKSLQIKIPRPSRGFFIDGYNPLILAYTSRRVSTICQPRRFCYLLPVNGFKSSPSSTVLQLCLHLAGGGYTLLFSLHFCLPYLHSILGTKIPDFGTYIATLDTSHKSSGCFSLSDIP